MDDVHTICMLNIYMSRPLIVWLGIHILYMNYMLSKTQFAEWKGKIHEIAEWKGKMHESTSFLDFYFDSYVKQ